MIRKEYERKDQLKHKRGLEKYRLEGERTAGSVLRALAAEILFFAITFVLGVVGTGDFFGRNFF